MDGSSYLMAAMGFQGVDAAEVINRGLGAGGLCVTSEEARLIADSRAEMLSEVERVEFGTPAIVSIAEAVATSSCLSQGSFVDDLVGLQSAFYRVRDELPAEVPDAEIVDAFRGCLDARGGVDLMAFLDAEEIMRYSEDYLSAVDSDAKDEYRIVDDEGRAYVFSEDEWAYDEQAAGWDGERWTDDWSD